jgi:transposase-like protein
MPRRHCCNTDIELNDVQKGTLHLPGRLVDTCEPETEDTVTPRCSSVVMIDGPSSVCQPRRRQALERWRREATRELEVNPNVLHRWRREFLQRPGNAYPGNGKPHWSEGRVAADAAGSHWKSAVYRKVQEEVKANQGLTIDRTAKLGRLSRPGCALRMALVRRVVEPGLIHHSDRGFTLR